jgi:hypothetical protein
MSPLEGVVSTRADPVAGQLLGMDFNNFFWRAISNKRKMRD